MVIPSDASYEGSDLRVYNQHTKLWRDWGLDPFVDRAQAHLANQHLLDTVEADSSQRDSCRGVVRASYGWCSDMSRSRTGEVDDLGFAVPNISANNNDLNKADSYGVMSDLARQLKLEWAKEEPTDPIERQIRERFLSHPDFCPPGLNICVPSLTNLRQTLFRLKEGHPPPPQPEFALEPSWGHVTGVPPGQEANLDIYEPAVDGANSLDPHTDNSNSDGAEVLTWSAPVKHRMELVRASSVGYPRASMYNFFNQTAKFGQEIQKAKAYKEALPHPSLSSPTLEGYNEIFASGGLLLWVDTESGTLIECAARTPASLSKAATFSSAIGASVAKLHWKHGLSEFQLLQLTLIGASVPTPFGVAHTLHSWFDDGVPGPELLVAFEEEMKAKFGGHSMGPCHRFQPPQTRPINKQSWAESLQALGDIRRRAEQRAAPIRASPRPLAMFRYQTEVETLTADLVNQIGGVGELLAQHIKMLMLQSTLLTLALMEGSSSYVSASAGYKDRKYSRVEMRQLLMAISVYNSQTVAMSEANLCEGSRGRRDIYDLFPANTFLIGNPIQREGFGPNDTTMQMMRLDTGQWEPMPPVVPVTTGETVEEEVRRHILDNESMPENIQVAHGDEVKKAVAAKYRLVTIPPMMGDPKYQACVAQVAAFKYEESRPVTMKRIQYEVESFLGCPLSDMAATLKACRSLAKANKATAAKQPPSAKKPPSPTVVEQPTSPTPTGFEASKPVPTLAALAKVSSGQASIELCGLVDKLLKATGKLPAKETFNKAKVHRSEAMSGHGRGDHARGYYCHSHPFGLDYSNWSEASQVVAGISEHVFGGFRVLDSTNSTEKIAFKTVGSAHRCLLFLTILLQGSLCKSFALDWVSRLFDKVGQHGVTNVWAKGRLVAVKLLAQGMPEPLGYLVVKDSVCCFGFAPKTQKSQPLFVRVVDNSEMVSAKKKKKKKAPPSSSPSSRSPTKKTKKSPVEDDEHEYVQRAVLWEEVQRAFVKKKKRGVPPLKKRKPAAAQEPAAGKNNHYVESNDPCQSFSLVPLEDDALWAAAVSDEEFMRRDITDEEIANLQANMLAYEPLQRVSLQEAVEEGQLEFRQQE